MSWYQKGKTNLDFTEVRESEWQWHQLGHMHICTSPQTDNHTSTRPLSFFTDWIPSCRPTNTVKVLKALKLVLNYHYKICLNTHATRFLVYHFFFSEVNLGWAGYLKPEVLHT